MHSIHVGQRALSLGSWQSGSPRSQSALGKGQAAGEQKLRGGCGREAGLGCEADILSARQELAAAPGHPGRDRGTIGPPSSQALRGMHRVQCCASVKGAAPASPPQSSFLFPFPDRRGPTRW